MIKHFGKNEEQIVRRLEQPCLAYVLSRQAYVHKALCYSQKESARAERRNVTMLEVMQPPYKPLSGEKSY